jgi:predicted SnoaL-like aldol condensation-catalyzing enzyme
VTQLEANKALSRRLYEEVFGRGKFVAADEIMAADALSHRPGTPPQAGTE